jgi:hypothetical protein
MLTKLEFFVQSFKNARVSNIMKIHPVGAKLFHADRQADVMKLMVTSHSFAKCALKISWQKHYSETALSEAHYSGWCLY